MLNLNRVLMTKVVRVVGNSPKLQSKIGISVRLFESLWELTVVVKLYDISIEVINQRLIDFG